MSQATETDVLDSAQGLNGLRSESQVDRSLPSNSEARSCNSGRRQARCGPMRSVPPRGSGWVNRLPNAECRMRNGGFARRNWQSEINNRQSKRPTRYRVVVLTSWVRRVSVCDGDPLPRGGTDLMGLPRECLRWGPLRRGGTNLMEPLVVLRSSAQTASLPTRRCFRLSFQQMPKDWPRARTKTPVIQGNSKWHPACTRSSVALERKRT